MNKLTAEKCRTLIKHRQEDQRASRLTILGELYLQALEIALPVLEGRIASSALPKEVFGRLYDQYLNGVICGEGNKSAAKDFMDACVVALYDCQPQPSTTPQIDNDGWVEWKGGDICPLNTPVKVRCRSGMEIPLKNPACGNWSHSNGSFDIIAYRVIENDGREG